MKKLLSLLLAALLTVGSLTACNGSSPADDGKLRIVTTIFPEYDWVMNILGDNPAGAEVTMLLDTGVDLHSFQPTADDILKISTADMFIYVGGESDEWVEKALAQAKNKNLVAINLLEVLGDAVKEEEVVEGMQADHDHDHEDGDDHDHEDADHEDEDHDHDHEDGEKEYDEHVWLSLRNASALVKHIAESLKKIDSSHADVYTANASAYTDKLKALDAEYQKAVDGSTVRTLLFGDRFPFRYLTEDYGLSYYAAFVGCSAESEASFETITFLSKKVDELGLSVVLTIEGTNHKIAETVVRSTQNGDQMILALDSMQSVTAKDVKDGANYLAIMEKNLEVLKEALK